MVTDRGFIFHIYAEHIPLGKALSLIPKSRSSVKVKVKYQGQGFRKKKKKCRCGSIGVSQTHLVICL